MTQFDDRVGYGRPPRATQFQKGKSGNPRGRPRRKRGLLDEIARELQAPSNVFEDGVSLPKQRVLAQVIVAKALAGDQQAIATLLRYAPAQENSGAEPDVPSPEEREAESNDEALIEAFTRRQRGIHERSAADDATDENDGGAE